jgi:hypothetical protein
MARSIDTNLFFSIISTEGCLNAFSDVKDGYRIEHYFSLDNSKRVLIDASCEFLDERYCKDILGQLQLHDLIDKIHFS